MNNKVYDVLFFVGGSALTLLGFFTTYNESSENFFNRYKTDWYDFLFIIVGISMIVFGFVRRSWGKKEDKK